MTIRPTTGSHLGSLYVIATPIGNLADITQRAIAVLGQVAVVAAEDTRHCKRLLQHLNLHPRLVALHGHNEHKQSAAVLARLQAGADVALVSDAGTPLISDPGLPLLRLAHEAGIPVIPIPGPCALIAALSVSGLPTTRFCFEGFLPPRAQARQQALQALAQETRTLVFYEAPHRLQAMLQDCCTHFGPTRPAVLARELTKTFETLHRAPLEQLLATVSADPNQQRGEMVVMIAGCQPAKTATLAPDVQRTLELLLAACPLSQAVQLASKITNTPKKPLYQAALQLSQVPPDA